MKAAVYYEIGGPEVFRYEDVADPVLRPGGLLIEVAAVGIQGGDLLHRQGGVLATTPHIVGYQAAGVVARGRRRRRRLRRRPAGGRDDGLRLPRRAGQRAGPRGVERCPTGSRSRRPPASRSSSAPPTTACSSSVTCRPARPCWSRPAPAASASPRSSWRRPPARRRCSPPRRATTGSSASHEYGMDHGINYAHARRRQRRCVRLTDGRGVDLVVDPVGGRRWRAASPPSPTGAASAGSAAPDGTSAPPEVWPLMQKNGSLTGVFLGVEMAAQPDRVPRPMIDALIARAGAGELTGRHRPHLPARRRRRGPPLHREPPGVRPRPPDPVISRARGIGAAVPPPRDSSGAELAL